VRASSFPATGLTLPFGGGHRPQAVLVRFMFLRFAHAKWPPLCGPSHRTPPVSSEQSGIPGEVGPHQELPVMQVEALSDVQTGQHSFVTRPEYLDRCVVRTAGYPERAMLEGSFSTKAESGVQTTVPGAAQDVLLCNLAAEINEDSIDSQSTRDPRPLCPLDDITSLSGGFYAPGFVSQDGSYTHERAVPLPRSTTDARCAASA
jgi:hypothetical protein